LSLFLDDVDKCWITLFNYAVEYSVSAIRDSIIDKVFISLKR
jgi:hypothetical protein